MFPKVSVIIVAHDRKKFLKYAVNSVINQSIPRDTYEIILVKNFIFPELDEEISKKGVQIVQTDEISLGAKILAGLKVCRGEIISFLEDDDLFFATKIERILNLFSEKNVIYYHNNYYLINENGERINGSLPYIPRHRREKNKKIVIETRKLSTTKINKLIREGGQFNLSCISIRRDLIMDKKEKLRGLTVALDYFMFYLALDSGLKIIIDSYPLTAYRVHLSNNSLAVGTEIQDFIKKKITFFSEDLKSLSSIRNFVNQKVVQNYISCRMLIPLMGLSMLKNDNHKIRPFILSAIKCIIKTKSKEMVVLLIINIINKIFKEFGGWFYFNYERRKLKNITDKV